MTQCTGDELDRVQQVMAMQAFYTDEATGNRLYIGPVSSARDQRTLLQHNVRSILTANTSPAWYPVQFDYLILNADDDEGEDLLSRFDDCVAWLTEALGRGSALVHCTAGVSRSASVAIAFLMRATACGFDQAFQRLRRARQWVQPNPAFQHQLRYYEAIVLNKPALTDSAPLPRGAAALPGGSKDDDDDDDAPCALCRLEKRTAWLYEDEQFVVALCEQCDSPMVVYRPHTMHVSAAVRREMFARLKACADAHYRSQGSWYLDVVQRTIPTHLHWHARAMTGSRPTWLSGLEQRILLDDDNKDNSPTATSLHAATDFAEHRRWLAHWVATHFSDRLVVVHWQYVDDDDNAAPARIANVHDQWLDVRVRAFQRCFQVVLVHVLSTVPPLRIGGLTASHKQAIRTRLLSPIAARL